jgi:uncharacterized protein
LKWKLTIVTVAVIFTLVNTIVPLLQVFFSYLYLPPLLKSLFGAGVMVSLMTFLIMPFLSRRLGGWLVQ